MDRVSLKTHQQNNHGVLRKFISHFLLHASELILNLSISSLHRLKGSTIESPRIIFYFEFPVIGGNIITSSLAKLNSKDVSYDIFFVFLFRFFRFIKFNLAAVSFLLTGLVVSCSVARNCINS